MFCLKCGEAIPEGSGSCPVCGTNPQVKADAQAVVYATQATDDALSKEPTKKRLPKALVIVSALALCAIVIYLAASGISKAKLKEKLIREWRSIDGSIIKVLDIDDNKIEYRLETGYRWLNTSLGSYEWKVVNSRQIKIKRWGDSYETYTIELNNTKNVLTVTPAITSTKPVEVWYYIND